MTSEKHCVMCGKNYRYWRREAKANYVDVCGKVCRARQLREQRIRNAKLEGDEVTIRAHEEGRGC